MRVLGPSTPPRRRATSGEAQGVADGTTAGNEAAGALADGKGAAPTTTSPARTRVDTNHADRSDAEACECPAARGGLVGLTIGGTLACPAARSWLPTRSLSWLETLAPEPRRHQMARIPIEMPKLGYDMETGTIAAWVKQVGDTIARGDVIAEIETEKSTVEMEALAGGTLVEQTLAPGKEVPVGSVIGYLEDGK